ncbi:MAG: hypothetical protein HY098_08840 [Nitrospinae bacterium]|nr:hypothetical protein [Nitrospinota bacterium]
MRVVEAVGKLDYPVPGHSMRVGYMLGGVAGFLLAFLFLTGGVMAFFGYVPASELAHGSVAYITTSSWLSGFRTAHSLEADFFLDLFAGAVGLKSLFIKNAATKMFVVHAVFLPLLLGGVLAGHAALIKINGISPLKPGAGDAGPQTTFFRHMRHVTAYGFMLLGLIHVVAAFYAPPLLGAPVEGVEWTKPAWPFLFLYPMGDLDLMIAPFAVVAVLLAIPLFANQDKKWDASQAIFFLLLFFWAALSLVGAFEHFA